MSEPAATPVPDTRRAPRLPIRCGLEVEAPEGEWVGETEDIGLYGCQLVAPGPMARGLQLRLRLAHRGMPSLRVSARVAWSGPHAPWRHGVAFAAADVEGVGRWLGRLLSLYPDLVIPSRIPAWLEPGDRLFLGEPPRQVVDFNPAELEVLRQVRDGLTVAELRGRLEGSWASSVRALFSLLAGRALTLDPARAARPADWQHVLGAVGDPPAQAGDNLPVARIATRRTLVPAPG
jgi:hypothetical protein